MKLEYKLILIFLFFGLFYTNCGPTGFQTNYNSVYSFSPTPGVTGGNVLPLKVIGMNYPLPANFVGLDYPNMLSVSAKICIPGTTTCDIITNLLLDTGSTGLRIFSGNLVNINAAGGLAAVNDTLTGYSLASCAVYGDATYHWGPVKTASVTLGDVESLNPTNTGLTEAAASMPIQVVDYTFGDTGTGCRNNAGMTVAQDRITMSTYSGILGIKFFKEDCGVYCLSNVIGANPSYYACNGANCGTVTVALANQIQNPIAALGGDNNGYSISLPAVPDTGAVTISSNAFLVLGIGTQSNNIPAASVQRLPAEATYGSIKINFNGTTVPAIIDSGSSANFFQYTGFSTCSILANASYGHFCPTNVTNFNITLYGNTGTKSINTSFSVKNADTLLTNASSYVAFNNIAAPLPAGPASNFYFGLPFFFGRKIYYGIENSTSPMGDGPFIGL